MTNGATPEERLSHLESDLQGIKDAMDLARHEAELKKEEIDRRLHEMNEMRDEITEERGQQVSNEKHDGDIKALRQEFSGAIKAQGQKIDGLQRLVYVGVGIILTAEIALRLAV